MAFIRAVSAGSVENMVSTILNSGAQQGDDGQRVAMVVHSSYRNSLGKLALRMAVNPSRIEPVQPKRMAKQDTLSGSVFHFFADGDGRNNDILTLRFAGNSGAIFVHPQMTEEEQARARTRHKMFFELANMTREPIRLSNGQQNLTTIQFASMLIPTPVTFSGFFPDTIRYTEDASEPRSVEYSFEFTVTKISPSLESLAERLFAPQAQSDATPVSDSDDISTLFTSTLI